MRDTLAATVLLLCSTLFIAFHVVLVFSLGLLLDTHLIVPSAGALVIALVCGIAGWRTPHAASTRMLQAVLFRLPRDPDDSL